MLFILSITAGLAFQEFLFTILSKYYSTWPYTCTTSREGTHAMNCMHLCLLKTLCQDCPHGEIRHFGFFNIWLLKIRGTSLVTQILEIYCIWFLNCKLKFKVDQMNSTSVNKGSSTWMFDINDIIFPVRQHTKEKFHLIWWPWYWCRQLKSVGYSGQLYGHLNESIVANN